MLRGKDCQPGDKVRLLHEQGEGIVVKKTAEFVYVDMGDGFELPVLYNDVIIIEKARQQTPLPESKHEEQGETPVHPPQKQQPQPSKEKIRGVKDDLVRGIYLAFAPVNQNILLTGDIRIYLINYTKLKVNYVLFTQSDKHPSEAYSGNAEPASALLIDTIDRKDTVKFRKAMFQCLFPQSTQKGMILPVYTHIEIKPERFYKEEMYTENYALSMFSLTVQLFRIEELRYSSLSAGKHIPSEGDEGLKSKIFRQEALIDRYKTAPGEAEVDLHIESIIGQDQVDNMQKLKKQLDFFTQCLEGAIEQGYSKVIFIHGVGVGVLKMEIHKILRANDRLEFRDAPIARYGIGATEVIIRKA